MAQDKARTLAIVPDRFHAILRQPSQKLHPDEVAFRDEMRIDIVNVSDETIDRILSNQKEPMWLKRLAAAEKIHRA